MTQNEPLCEMFASLTPRYDLLNRIMTLGLDRRWRLKAAGECLVSKPARVLDLCCGTGDLVTALSYLAPKEAELVALDFSRPMLKTAIRKASLKTRGRKITFINGNASSLPFPDGYFDAIGISFAFRNLTYKNHQMGIHLQEITRVLNKGGRLVIVETSQPKAWFIRKLYYLYLHAASGLGWLLSGNRGAYHYLAESAAGYFSP